jgi:hypothetical protein
VSYISPFFFVSNEIILFQILYRLLKFFFSLMKVKIVKFIQCGPCFINGPKFQEIWFLKKNYIIIGHLVLATFIHFTPINTQGVCGENIVPKKVV